MSKALSALVGVLMLGSAGMASAAEPVSSASAAEPVSLTDKQMDGVTAGYFSFDTQALNAAGNIQLSLLRNNNIQNVNGSAISQD